tara:strand:- start:250 stop:675 length:426 start_codon:yes stop_codon:yes gene_type:complete
MVKSGDELMTEHEGRATIRLAITVCGLTLLLSSCGGTETDFDTVTSPGGEFRLVVTVTVPALPHARHIVTAYLERESLDGREKLIETKLANDGVPFTARNIGIRWTGATTALICLRPTDLADRGIRVDVSGTPSAVIKPGC